MPERNYFSLQTAYEKLEQELFDASAEYLQNFLRENFASYDELPFDAKDCVVGYFDTYAGRYEYTEEFEGTLEDIIAYIPILRQHHSGDYLQPSVFKVEIRTPESIEKYNNQEESIDYQCLEVAYDGHALAWWETIG